MEKRKKILIIAVGSIIAAGAVALILLDLFKVPLLVDSIADKMLKGILMRLIAGVGVIFLTVFCGYKYFSFKGITLKGLIFCVPLFLVVLNNFPFIDFFLGKLSLDRIDLIWIFALECALVGIFEELLFRGIVFSFCLEKWNKNARERFIAIIVSSAVFGLFHIVNLFGGAGFGAVAMQVGYSFLMGALFSIIMLKTKCVWIAAITHAVYNFGGLLFPTLGTGNVWGVGTIILTAVVGVLVAVYSIVLMTKTFDSGIEVMINKKQKTK